MAIATTIVTILIIGFASSAHASGAFPRSSGGGTNASCYSSGGALYCGNDTPSTLWSTPKFFSSPIDTLRSNPSYFRCWVTGSQHGGGNNVWYYTFGDDSGRWGYIAASHVWTSQDPFPGVSHC
ncbi:hypothetical protein HNR73_005901 [Phytomonospora endophytica]|uniref:SH3 domain-containing protein n=1 Tax=Phytomonospora endophytica TaxID=714109 RepID=A0A841FL05_9ACTN|nr:hypothetical protein [Phytomonospora endophytica]